MKEVDQTLLEVLKQDTTYATGCTDPIGIALASAAAHDAGKGEIQKITIVVSPNIFKNASGVGIPGTKKKGIQYAAAMGIVTGQPNAGLDVLRQVKENAANEAEQLLEQAKTEVTISDNGILLYIDVRIDTDLGWSQAVIQDDYDNVTRVIHNGELVNASEARVNTKKAYDLSHVTVDDVFAFAETIPIDHVQFLMDGADGNYRAAVEGIEKKASCGLGYALSLMHCSDPILGAVLQARTYTAGAADARMAGFPVRIMTVAGSGNHGITALLSVLAVRDFEKMDNDKTIRGLVLSALMTIYIKSHVKRMSAFCGCAVAAATGAAAGITIMLGGTRPMAIGAMNSIMGNLTGMICDGAKESCSYKVSVAAGEAVLHSYLSLQGVAFNGPGGIVGCDAKESFINMGLINDPGMKVTDRVILDIAKKRI